MSVAVVVGILRNPASPPSTDAPVIGPCHRQIPIEHGAGETMACFAAIELGQNASAIAFIIQICQEIARFVNAAEFPNIAGEVSGHSVTSCTYDEPYLENGAQIWYDWGLGFGNQIGGNTGQKVNASYLKVEAGGACSVGTTADYTNEGYHYIQWPNGSTSVSAAFKRPEVDIIACPGPAR